MGARDPHLEDSASTSRSPTSVIDHSHAVHSYSSKNNYHEISVKKKAHPKKYLGSSYPQKEEEIQQKKTRKHGGKTPTRCYPTALQTFVFISFVVALVSVIVSASLFLDFPIGKGYPLSTSSLPKNISLQKFLNKNSTDLEEFQAKLENFIIKIEKWVEDQLQMEDEKLVGELEKIKSEMEVALRDHLHVVANQLDKMDEHLQEVEQSLEILEEKGLLTVSEAMELINNALKEKDAVGDKKAVISLDDIRAATRRIIEAEIEKHSADGIGRVDYAASSGGGKVLGHSEGYYNGIGLSWRHVSNRLISLNHPLANEILQPRFGEPGKCLPLKGSDVFVIIGLRTPIFAEAISVEHVSKKVAYDLTSAPRQFKVYGSNSTNENQQSSWILLGEFTYDIFANKIIQTFNLLNGNIAETKISTAKLHILSNHGSQSHTCIYRVRVHGHE